MNPSRAVIGLSVAVVALGIAASGIGLFWQTDSAPYAFRALSGDMVDIFARGIYADDSVFKSGANRGGDVTTLFLAAPVLLIALYYYRRRSVRGAVILLGALTHFLYVYASLALGAAYNALFLVYTAIFGCSFYAWLLLIFAVQPVMLRFALDLPYRRIGAFLLACGVLTSFVWIEPLVSAFLAGHAPKLLGHSTTMVTEALDLATIVPACFVAGVLFLQRDRRALLFAIPVLALLFFIGPSIAAMTVFQIGDGISFTIPQIVGPIGGFLVLGVINLWVVAVILRAAPGAVTDERAQTGQPAHTLAQLSTRTLKIDEATHEQ